MTTSDLFLRRRPAEQPVLALAGNPNTGKSTVFNALTGMRQHTGNWPGKTVLVARGTTRHRGRTYTVVDLPGTYSLAPHSADEEAAGDFLRRAAPDVVCVVVDATCLERNLTLVLQVMAVTAKVVVLLNLVDEARRKGLAIDTEVLAGELGVPVVASVAREGRGLTALMDAVEELAFGRAGTSETGEAPVPTRPEAPVPTRPEAPVPTRPEAPAGSGTKPDAGEAGADAVGEETEERAVSALYERAARVAAAAVSRHGPGRDITSAVDRVLTSPLTGFPIMFLALGAVIWLTVVGANYPSEVLAGLLFGLGRKLDLLFAAVGVPPVIHGLVIDGAYLGLAWVVSVMLPPMAIFFPCFSLLEDLGYLPRVAFNLDAVFKRAGACGKQALTMSMGLGCNAAGVISCRIIESPRERLIAILTNTFTVCNGRFPTLIVLSTIFTSQTLRSTLGAGGAAALAVAGLIIAGMAATFAASWLLSRALPRGLPSSFILELPPIRPPRVAQVLVRSVMDRTLFVLWRAVVVATPAGAVVWILGNTVAGDQSLLAHLASLLGPLGTFVGLDGFILAAFILGLPANEIVLPLLLMGYLSAGTMVQPESAGAVGEILVSRGWTTVTAVCFMLFSLLHWPCGTTLLTVWKETRSRRWTLAAFLLPALVALGVCAVVAFVARLGGA